MKLRKWTPEEKMAILLEGIKGQKSVADICREHQISQALYYRWRDKFLEGGKKGLGTGAGEGNGYRAEIEKLQKIIGKQTIQIEPGDTLVLYTDGITEAQDQHGALFGKPRLHEVLGTEGFPSGVRRLSAQHIQEALLAEVRRFVGQAPQFDDMTLVVLVRDS